MVFIVSLTAGFVACFIAYYLSIRSRRHRRARYPIYSDLINGLIVAGAFFCVSSGVFFLLH